MNKKNLLWILLALVLLGLIGFAIVMMNRTGQGAYVAQTTSSSSVTPEVKAPVTPPVVPPTVPVTTATSTQTEGFAEINHFTVSWNGKPYQFIHRCLGEVKVGTGDVLSSQLKYCVGDNQLSVRTRDGEESIIQSGISQDATTAPVLTGADWINVSSDAKGTVLLSYQPDPCAAPDNACGAGMDYNFVNFAYSLLDGKLQPLKHYPGTGWPTWNAGIGGTKAIFIPDTCGGAGCGMAPLTGYDLSTDTARLLSSIEHAAGAIDTAKDGVAGTADGTSLPTWVYGSVHWTSDVDFTAQIRQLDGSLKTVAGKF